MFIASLCLLRNPLGHDSPATSMLFATSNRESVGGTMNQWLIGSGLYDLVQRANAVDVLEALGRVEQDPVWPVTDVVS
jgi:hypothetical protein